MASPHVRILPDRVRDLKREVGRGCQFQLVADPSLSDGCGLVFILLSPVEPFGYNAGVYYIGFSRACEPPLWLAAC